jgi:hypothetical protein
MAGESATWLSQHGMHALLTLVPAVLIAAIALGSDARAWLRKRDHPSQAGRVVVAALLSCGAGAVHGFVCPEHFREGLIYGVVLLAIAVAQVVWAGLVVLRRQRWLLVAGAIGNLSVLVLWLMTRNVGIPLGPEAGVVEGVGVLDALASACELGVVGCCVWSLLPTRPGRLRRLGLADVSG